MHSTSTWLIFTWGNVLLLGIAFLIALLLLRFLQRLQTTSLLSAASACCGIFNPYVAHRVLGLVGANTAWRLYLPESFIVPLIAIVSGHIALRHIRRSPTPLDGRGLAWVGCCLGYAALACGIGYFLIYALGWSGVVG